MSNEELIKRSNELNEMLYAARVARELADKYARYTVRKEALAVAAERSAQSAQSAFNALLK